jgi:UDP-N-acetyl-D-mannosaminuronic acid dehydrogenase
MLNPMVVAVIGLGFVGLTLSLALADKGVKVYGVETNPNTLKILSQGIPTFNENGIEHYLERNIGKNFQVFAKLDEFPSQPDTYVICVATPIFEGTPNMSQLKAATESVGKYFSGDELIIIRSTSPVGTTRKFILPILAEELQKRNIKKSIKIVFAPERTAEGVALKELNELPQIVGGLDKECAIKAIDLFRRITPTIIEVSSLETAEMIKLIDNSFRDVRFAYANEISVLAEKMGVDANECITKANIHYQRNNIPLPSPGVGGPCLSKDSYLLAGNKKTLESIPNYQSIVLTGRNVNELMPILLVEKIKTKILKIKKSSDTIKIFVMGFAFKGEPETSDIRDSPTLVVVKNLINDYKVFGHDALVSKEEIEKTKVIPVNVEDGFKNADCVVIMNNHKNYKNLDIEKLFQSSCKPCIFVDCWRLFDKTMFENNPDITYTGVGIE